MIFHYLFHQTFCSNFELKKKRENCRKTSLRRQKKAVGFDLVFFLNSPKHNFFSIQTEDTAMYISSSSKFKYSNSTAGNLF